MDERLVTQLERFTAAVIAEELEPDPPMDRGGYNRRGRLVAWLLRLALRRWPIVFWNETAHARQRVREGAAPYVVRL